MKGPPASSVPMAVTSPFSSRYFPGVSERPILRAAISWLVHLFCASLMEYLCQFNGVFVCVCVCVCVFAYVWCVCVCVVASVFKSRKVQEKSEAVCCVTNS